MIYPITYRHICQDIFRFYLLTNLFNNNSYTIHYNTHHIIIPIHMTNITQLYIIYVETNPQFTSMLIQHMILPPKQIAKIQSDSIIIIVSCHRILSLAFSSTPKTLTNFFKFVLYQCTKFYLESILICSLDNYSQKIRINSTTNSYIKLVTTKIQVQIKTSRIGRKTKRNHGKVKARATAGQEQTNTPTTKEKENYLLTYPHMHTYIHKPYLPCQMDNSLIHLYTYIPIKAYILLLKGMHISIYTYIYTYIYIYILLPTIFQFSHNV